MLYAMFEQLLLRAQLHLPTFGHNNSNVHYRQRPKDVCDDLDEHDSF